MKRLSVLVALVAVFCLVLTGCGAKEKPGRQEAGAPDQKVINLKFAHYISPTSLGHLEAHVKWAKMVEERTNGKVKITVYPGQTLGKATDEYEMVTSGIADIAWGFTGFFPGRFPLSEVVGLPMLGIETATQGSKVLQDLYQNTPYLKNEYPGVKVLFLHACDSAPISSKNPINSEADLAGMKVRSPSGGPMMLLKDLGASPVPVPAPDIYESAQKGVIDACALSAEGSDGFKLQEVYKKFLNANFFVGPFWVIMNQKTWDSLPPDVQKAIEEVSGQFGAEMYGKAWDKAAAAAYENIKKSGATVYQLPPGETERWQKKASIVWDKWAADMEAKGLPGKAVLQETLKLVEKYKQ